MGKPKSAETDWAHSRQRIGKGKLYLRFVVAVAVIVAALYSYSALASAPTAAPGITASNGTGVNGIPIPNASIARATDNLSVVEL